MEKYSSASESMPTSKPRVVVYLDDEIKNHLEKLAEVNDRPVSNFVLRLIKNAIAEAKEKGAIQ